MVAFHLKVKMMRIQEWQKAVVRRISGSQAAVCLMWKPVRGGGAKISFGRRSAHKSPPPQSPFSKGGKLSGDYLLLVQQPPPTRQRTTFILFLYLGGLHSRIAISRTSASLPAEQLEQLEPDNAQYAGGYAYNNIYRMYQRESEYLSKKWNIQNKTQKDNRAAGYPPESCIGSLVDIANSAGPGTVGHHKPKVGDYQGRKCQSAGLKFALPTGKADAKYSSEALPEHSVPEVYSAAGLAC